MTPRNRPMPALPTAVALVVVGVILLVVVGVGGSTLLNARTSGETVAAGAGVASTTSTSATTVTTTPPPADPGSPARILTPLEDRPNPFVLVANGRYYLYSSSAASIYSTNIPTRVSTDLVNWTPITDALPKLPAWATWGGIGTWAPDVRWVAGRYVMYYTALVKGMTNTKCIGTATSSTPQGPFTPFDQSLVCQLDHRGSIDPRTFIDVHGTVWLDWKSDDNADTEGTTHSSLYAQRLSNDGLSVVGPSTVLLTADQAWEGRIVEAPQMVLWNSRYWVFYSGNWFNQPYYAIGVAQCAGPAGPCSKPFPHPFLASNAQGQGPGESSLFIDHNLLGIVYGPLAVHYKTDTPRPVALAHIAFNASGPYLAAPSPSPPGA